MKKSPEQFEQSPRVTPSLRSRAGSEPFASLKGKLREGAVAIGSEILRCAEA
jgi:hypothetical protein